MSGSRELSLEVLAEVTARIDAGESKEAVLADFSVGARQFAELQTRWLAQIGHQVLSGQFDLQRQYAAEYQLHFARAQAKAATSQEAASVEEPRAAAARPKPMFNKTMVGTPEMFAAAESVRGQSWVSDTKLNEPPLIAAMQAAPAPAPVQSPPWAGPVQPVAPPQVVSPPPIAAPAPVSPQPAAPAPVSPQSAAPPEVSGDAATIARPRAFAKTSFANSGFSIFPQGTEPTPAAGLRSPPPAAPASPAPPGPQHAAQWPAVPPAAAVPAFPAPAMPAPVMPAPVMPGPAMPAPVMPAPVMPAAPAFAAPAAPAQAAPPPFMAGRGAEPPMAPGYRNALGSLPPAPARPAAGMAPAAPAAAPYPVAAPPLANAAFGTNPTVQAPPGQGQFGQGQFGQGAPGQGAPVQAPFAQTPFGQGPAAPAAPALPPLNASWDRPPGGQAGAPAPLGGYGGFGAPAAPAPFGGGLGASPFGGAQPAQGYPGGFPAAPAGQPGGFAAGGGPQMPAVASQSLSLEQIACIQAELDVDAGRAAAVFASNGISSADYERQFLQLKATLGVDEHKAQRFEQLRTYYRALVGPRR